MVLSPVHLTFPGRAASRRAHSGALGHRTRPDLPSASRVSLGGILVDLLEFEDAVEHIMTRALAHDQPPLAVASINLDHLHHFGTGSRLPDSIEATVAGTRTLEWLNLVDGAPLAVQARRLTGRVWPRLAGSDLIGPIVARAERDGTSIGFLGGSEATHSQLRARLAAEHPALRVSGYWAPSREDLSNRERSRALAGQVAAAQTDLLVVALGKPRQELWIAEHGSATGAQVFLAFGAVVDFLAGRIRRAPRWISRLGMEWAWRLALEPRRLARRYLIEGPRAMRLLLGSATTLGPALTAGAPSRAAAPLSAPASIIVPAHNEAQVIGRMLRPLLPLLESGEVEIIVVCNGCTDDTADIARRFAGVRVIEITEASKPAALNRGDASAAAWPRLYLDADIEISASAVRTVLGALASEALLAARPSSAYDTGQAEPIVRSYYRARSRIPSLHAGLWGAGAYALSRAGHDRLGAFPDLMGDDFWVDQLFDGPEKAVLNTTPVIVRTPRDLPGLARMLRRHAVNVTQARPADGPSTSSRNRTLRQLVRTVHGPQSAVDACVYAALSLNSHLHARRRGHDTEWEGEASSRHTALPGAASVRNAR